MTPEVKALLSALARLGTAIVRALADQVITPDELLTLGLDNIPELVTAIADLARPDDPAIVDARRRLAEGRSLLRRRRRKAARLRRKGRRVVTAEANG